MRLKPGLHSIRSGRAFSISENVTKIRLQIIVVPEFLPNWNKIDFCGRRHIYVGGFELSELYRPALKPFWRVNVYLMKFSWDLHTYRFESPFS